MTELTRLIRDRLDGWAPPIDDGPPQQFVEILDPGDLTQEQIREWHERWDEVLVRAADQSLHILATAPRFYPGFEQMRDALLTVLDLHPPTDLTVVAIAEKLGIEVTTDD